MVLTGNCSLELMGLPTYGFGGGRLDAWEPDDGTWWGPEVWNPHDVHSMDEMVSRDERWHGENGDADYDLQSPLAASHQALIYVNPEGPYANGDPLGSARDIRTTFTRMAMNDEETVALIAGGHAFGKSHGQVPATEIGPSPELAPIESMGLGWHNPRGTGNAEFTSTNGIEGSWTQDPTRWDNSYLENLFGHEWEQTRSPAGALQWTPKDPDAPKTPDAHTSPAGAPAHDDDLGHRPQGRPGVPEGLRALPRRLRPLHDRVLEGLVQADAPRHGPKHRYLGPEVTIEDELLWQDPLPDAAGAPLTDADVATLKAAVRDAGIDASDLVFTAYSAASTYRDSDKRGGANGGRIALSPQKDWAVNGRTVPVVEALQRIRAQHPAVSLADPRRARRVRRGRGRRPRRRRRGHRAVHAGSGGHHAGAHRHRDVRVAPADRGRLPELPVRAVRAVRPRRRARAGVPRPGEPADADRTGVDRPDGGLRVLGTNWDGSDVGVLTHRVGTLSTDWFVNLTDTDLVWTKTDDTETVFAGTVQATGEQRWTASRHDLVFGSNAQLRSVVDAYAGRDGQERFVRDFVAAWDKLMMLDRYDVKGHRRYGPMAA